MFWVSFLLFISFFCVCKSWMIQPTRCSMVMRSSTNTKSNTNIVSSVSTRRNFFTSSSATSAILFTSSLFILPNTKPLPVYAATSPTTNSNLPPLGMKAPDFDLPNSQGTGTTTLSSLIQDGKWTVLYFYPGAFTSGCTLEARGFQQDMNQYRLLNTQIVGVSVDSVEKNAQFCSTEKLDFYMLTDEKGEVSKLYGSALTVPGFGTFSNRQTYIIDPQGNLRWVFTDVESRVSRHSSDVLAKLEEFTKEEVDESSSSLPTA